jgi:hypothetical protein
LTYYVDVLATGDAPAEVVPRLVEQVLTTDLTGTSYPRTRGADFTEWDVWDALSEAYTTCPAVVGDLVVADARPVFLAMLLSQADLLPRHHAPLARAVDADLKAVRDALGETGSLEEGALEGVFDALTTRTKAAFLADGAEVAFTAERLEWAKGAAAELKLKDTTWAKRLSAARPELGFFLHLHLGDVKAARKALELDLVLEACGDLGERLVRDFIREHPADSTLLLLDLASERYHELDDDLKDLVSLVVAAARPSAALKELEELLASASSGSKGAVPSTADDLLAELASGRRTPDHFVKLASNEVLVTAAAHAAQDDRPLLDELVRHAGVPAFVQAVCARSQDTDVAALRVFVEVLEPLLGNFLDDVWRANSWLALLVAAGTDGAEARARLPLQVVLEPRSSAFTKGFLQLEESFSARDWEAFEALAETFTGTFGDFIEVVKSS